MANSGVHQSYDDRLTSFYLEKLCLEADVLYRFAFALTFNREASFKYVKETFTQAVNQLSEFAALEGSELRVKLFSLCLDMHRKQNVQYPNDEHGVSKLLAGQSEINRVVLILVDSGALSANEVSDLLGEDETVIRRNLAHARKKLIETIVY